MKRSFFLSFVFGLFVWVLPFFSFSQTITVPIHYSKWIKNYINIDSLRGVTSYSQIPIAFYMAEADGNVEQYEKLEIGISLPEEAKTQIENFIQKGKGINPFDPDQIAIKAHFSYLERDRKEDHSYENVNYSLETAHAFYYEEYQHLMQDQRFKHGYWKKDTTSFNFRIRFSPRKLGWWSCTINILVGNEIKYVLQPFDFLCILGPSKGFITGVSEDHRLLQYETGENFFGIGQNIPVPDLANAVKPAGLNPSREQPPMGFTLQRSYIADLAKHGGNLVRIMHGEWADALEWEKLNDYSMNMNFAWEFDQTINLCRDMGVYLLWVQQYHVPLMAHNPYGNDSYAWPSNPYHLDLNLEKPEDFFTDERALKLYKHKILYLLSRWGYSRMIAGIQPINEINEVGADQTSSPQHHPYFKDTAFRNDVAIWFTEIKNYIQKDLGYDFLVGSSFTGDVGAHVVDDPIMKIADFNDYHPYGQNRNRNLGARFGGINVTPGYGIFKRYQKPVIIGEMGTWDTEFLQECHENEFHNDLWGTAFLGGWAGGLHWHNWEDNYQMKLRENYIGLRNFLSDHFDTGNQYEPARWPEKNINDTTYSEKESNYFEALYLIGKEKVFKNTYAIGWVHNRSAYWYNYPETECEKKLSNTKAKTTDGKKKFRPDDDDTSDVLNLEGEKNEKKRMVKIAGLQRLKKYEIYFYNTKDETTITKYSQFHSFGKLELKIPEEIHQMPYQDLAFKIVRKKDNYVRAKF